MLPGAMTAIAVYTSGTAVCRNTCSGYDTSDCGTCGNGTIEAGEDCDGSNVNGQTCTTVPGGFTGGTLGCNASCRFDTTACTAEMSTWDPNGTYRITDTSSGAADVMMRCAWWWLLGDYAVDFWLENVALVDNGTTLRINQIDHFDREMNCQANYVAWDGGSAQNPTRTFTVDCFLPGECNELYTLTATFDASGNVFIGTLTAQFTQSSGPVFVGCRDCDDHVWTFDVTGTRN
jgi:hypothetical protein